jgi:pimeloyl-ACP methyl ester carboxylesterase
VHSIFRAAAHGVMAPTLMIWLPGAYHAARDFLEAGFPEAVLLRHLPVDLSFVDLELRYLGDDAAQQQLRTEVVLPARKLGVSVWLAGVSLGGFIALDYAATFAGELDGVCLLAPYLGNRMLTAEIASAPGLDAWAPGELAEADAERRVWRYLKTRVADPPALYLGFGHDDRFAAAHKLLAAALPAASVDVIAGGHEWRTWAKLWENFLESRFT